LEVQESAFVAFDGLFFLVFDLLYLSQFYSGFDVLSASNASIRGIQILFGHQKQQSFHIGAGPALST
jgi:hypothetical protein